MKQFGNKKSNSGKSKAGVTENLASMKIGKGLSTYDGLDLGTTF
jgi:hypothetical protein